MKEIQQFMSRIEFEKWQYEHSDTIFKYEADKEEAEKNEKIWNLIFDNIEFKKYAPLLSYKMELYMLNSAYPQEYDQILNRLKIRRDKIESNAKNPTIYNDQLMNYPKSEYSEMNERLKFIEDNRKNLDAKKFLIVCLYTTQEKGLGYFKEPIIKIIKKVFTNEDIENIVIPYTAHVDEGNRTVLKTLWLKELLGKGKVNRIRLPLTNKDIRDFQQLLDGSDVYSITDFPQVGTNVCRIYYENLSQYKDDTKYIEEIILSDDFLRCVNPQKYMTLIMYEVIDIFIVKGLNKREIEKNYSNYRNIFYIINKAKSIIDFDKKGEDLLFSPYIKGEIEEREDEQGNKLHQVNIINKDIVKQMYDEYYQKYVDSIIKGHPQFIPNLLMDENVEKDEEFISKCLEQLADNQKARFLFNAFAEVKQINAEELNKICEDNNINKIMIVSTLLNEYMKDKKLDLTELFRNGYIDQDTILKLYITGNIDFKKILEINKYLEKNGLVDYDNSKINMDISRLIKAYLQLDKEKIIKTLYSKNNWSNKEIAEFIVEHPYLKENLNQEEMALLQAEYLLQKEFLKEFYNKNPKEKQKNKLTQRIKEELGIAYLSSDIVFDLYKEGIIDYKAGFSDLEGGSQFEQKVKIYESERNGDISNSLDNSRKVINMYRHGRIGPEQIINLYCDGKLSYDIYTDLKSEDFNNKLRIGTVVDAYKTAILEKNPEKVDDYFARLERYNSEFINLTNKPEEILKLSQEIEKINEGISRETILKLAEYGTFVKEALKSSLESDNFGLIAELITGKNTLDIQTLKYLFEDGVNQDGDISTHKRDLLEYVFLSSEELSNQDKMSILISVYGGNKYETQEQTAFNYENFHYFLDSGYVVNEAVEANLRKRKSKVGYTKSNLGTTNGTKLNKLDFPLLERYDELFSLAPDTVFNYNENSYIFRYPSLHKVVIETLGKVDKDKKIIDNKTNHATYFLDEDLFDRNKDNFIDVNGKQEVFQFKKFIPWFREMRHFKTGMRSFKHTSGWAANIKKFVGIEKDSSKSERESINNEKID